jgi:hypothetical protein
VKEIFLKELRAAKLCVCVNKVCVCVGCQRLLCGGRRRGEVAVGCRAERKEPHTMMWGIDMRSSCVISVT